MRRPDRPQRLGQEHARPPASRARTGRGRRGAVSRHAPVPPRPGRVAGRPGRDPDGAPGPALGGQPAPPGRPDRRRAATPPDRPVRSRTAGAGGGGAGDGRPRPRRGPAAPGTALRRAGAAGGPRPALATRPALVVLDEAVSNLDAPRQVEILDHLAALRRRHGTAFLLVTHDVRLARRFADRIVVLGDGRIVDASPCRPVLSLTHPAARELLDAVLPAEPAEAR